MGKCKDCKNISQEECDESLCPFLIDSKCVKVDTDELDCIDIEEDDLDSVLVAMCEAISTNWSNTHCPCPVSTYEVNSICELSNINGVINLQVIVTPNFSQTTPTYIDIAINDMVVSIGKKLILSVVADTPITFNTYVFGSFVPDDGSFRTRVIDNLGNYSEEFELEDVLAEC